MKIKKKIKRLIKIILSFSLFKFKFIRTRFVFIGSRYLSPSIYLKLYDEISQNASFDELLHLVSYLHKKYPEDLGIAEKLIGLYKVEQRYEEAITLARTLCRRRKNEVASTLDSDYETKINGPQLGPFIQISGYFYSGSGAVLDYLKGYEESIKWVPGGEVRIVKFPGGLASIYKKLISKQKITIVEMVDLYLHLTGCFYVTTKRKEYSKLAMVNKNSKKVLASKSAATYVYELFRLWEQLDDYSQKVDQIPDEFIKLVKTGLHRAFNAVLYTNKVKILLLDQMITAWRLPTAVLLPPSKFIVVHRDPRDQYVDADDAMGMPGRPKWTTEKYVQLYRKRRLLVDEWIPKLINESGHSFLTMGFESFIVNNVKNLEKLEEFLHLEKYKFSKDLTKFNPKKSIVNVGKYKKYLNKKTKEIIEHQLPEYCLNIPENKKEYE
jgi:hypothetical protein